MNLITLTQRKICLIICFCKSENAVPFIRFFIIIIVCRYWGSPRGCDFPYDFFVKNHPMKRFKPAPYTPYYLKQLRRLEKKSEAEPISCIACPLQFRNCDELTKHYDLSHALHECVHCSEVLENFSSYERHLWERHGINMPVNCLGGRWRVLDELSQNFNGELELTRANVRFFHNYAEPNAPPLMCKSAAHSLFLLS